MLIISNQIGLENAKSGNLLSRIFAGKFEYFQSFKCLYGVIHHTLRENQVLAKNIFLSAIAYPL